MKTASSAAQKTRVKTLSYGIFPELTSPGGLDILFLELRGGRIGKRECRAERNDLHSAGSAWCWAGHGDSKTLNGGIWKKRIKSRIESLRQREYPWACEREENVCERAGKNMVF